MEVYNILILFSSNNINSNIDNSSNNKNNRNIQICQCGKEVLKKTPHLPTQRGYYRTKTQFTGAKWVGIAPHLRPTELPTLLQPDKNKPLAH